VPLQLKNLLAMLIYLGAALGIGLGLRDGLRWSHTLSWVIGLFLGSVVFALLQQREFYSRRWRK
jgi:hypothetical protein